MAIANRDAGSRRRPRQDLGAITSQKVVAQSDQLTRLNKQFGVNGTVNSSPDDIGC